MRAVWIVLLAVGCGGSSSSFEPPANEGNKDGPCYPNNTCNSGLVCVATKCVESSADSGPADATSTTDSSLPIDTGAAESSTDTTPSPPYTESSIAAACEDISDDIASANGDDVSSDRMTIPFTLKFFGDDVTQFSMASNGFLQLWSSSSGGVSKRPDNVAIPSADDPNGFVAPFWDDLVPMFSNARAGVGGTAPNRRLVVSWVHWTIKGETTTRISFQAKLFETTNVIELHYCAMSPDGNARATGSSATIGLENLTGTKGIQHSLNTAGAATTGKAFRYTP